MIVAVSRAKDAFLVFGNYPVLKGSENAASDLLHTFCKDEVPEKVVMINGIGNVI